jgi:hypothetical protein
VKIDGDGINTPLGKKPYETPRALETWEIAAIVADYRRAAARARAAGFDGVEVHAANGYLIDQFLQSKTNLRTDDYGGSIEKRARFLREVVEAVSAEWPAHRVGVRISPNGVFNDMGSPNFREQFTHVATMLDRCGLAYLHVVDGLAFGFHTLGQPMTLAEFRRVFSGPLMGNCGYTLESAEQAVAGELFVNKVAGSSNRPRIQLIEPILMMLPPRAAARSWRATLWVAKTWWRRLMARQLSQYSGVRSSRACRSSRPALLTRTRIGPHCAATRSSSACRAAMSRTSQAS